jgi:hypothetical protein
MDNGALIMVLLIWAVSAFVAGIIASDRKRSGLPFAAVTFFFLGPLGPGFALLATNGELEEARLRAAQAASSNSIAPDEH